MGITIDSNIGMSRSVGEIGGPKKSTSDKFAEALGSVAKTAATAAAGVAAGPIGSAIVSRALSNTSNLPADSTGMISQMQSRGMELLMLQMQIQQESQYFNTQTNIMKTDHDARMSSIRNLKG